MLCKYMKNTTKFRIYITYLFQSVCFLTILLILINDNFVGIFFELLMPLIGPHSIQFLNGPTARRLHSELKEPFSFSNMDKYNDIIHRVSFLRKNHKNDFCVC